MTSPAPVDPDLVPLRPSEAAPHHRARRGGPSGRNARRLAVGLLVALALGGVVAGTGMLQGILPHPVVAGDPKASGHDTSAPPRGSAPQSVLVARPKHDPSVQVAVEQLATVEAYYRADLRARASGLVTAVHKDIGDPVRQGDLLVEIDVPDLLEEVAQKVAVVGQRLQEVRVSQAHLRDAEAGREVARAAIREKQALVVEAEATRDFRRKRLARLRQLASRDTVVAGVIDEEERESASSEAAVLGATVAVERVRADLAEAESKVEAAAADIDLKGAMVEVARRDADRARALADYSRVVAPFDGVVLSRSVDLGSFVQNATTGQSEPLISVARTDLVTVVARFTDAAAPFVTEETEAEIAVNTLPGVTLRGRVTRFSPSIQNSDRTMRVEVDLFNGGEKDYRRIVGRVLGAGLAPLAAADPLGLVAARGVSALSLGGLRKGDNNLLPVGSAPPEGGGPRARLIPGMTGNMKLILRQFQGGYVVPSTAVFTRTGKPYLMLVEGGKTRQVPVQVQLNDGRVAKVLILSRRKDATGASREATAELTGGELVLTGRQLEVGEGAAVAPSPTEW